MRKRLLSFALGALLCGGGLALAAGTYTQTFDGAPPAPLVYPLVTGLGDWDVAVHSDNLNPATWGVLPGVAIQADHGTGCQAPPAKHPMGMYNDAVFQCSNHVMPSIFARDSYAVIYLVPPALLDFA